VPRVSEVLREQVESQAALVLAPYLSALAERPDPAWTPRQRLQFYRWQVGVSEKLLDRTFGRPVVQHSRANQAGGQDLGSALLRRDSD
jgi:hypothetical protein